GARCDEIIERHGRLRLDFQVEILAVAVGGNAEPDVRFAVAVHRLDRARRWRGQCQAGTGDNSGLQKMAAGRNGHGYNLRGETGTGGSIAEQKGKGRADSTK